MTKSGSLTVGIDFYKIIDTLRRNDVFPRLKGKYQKSNIFDYAFTGLRNEKS
jgi:hypothetical protein